MNVRNVLGVIVGVTLVTALGVIQLAEAVNSRSTNDRSALEQHKGPSQTKRQHIQKKGRGVSNHYPLMMFQH